MEIKLTLLQESNILHQLTIKYSNITLQELCEMFYVENPECSTIQLATFLKKVTPNLGLSDAKQKAELFLSQQ